MPSVLASKTYTLRLKQSNTTIVLFADPAQTLHSLKETLISALKSTSEAGTFNSQPIPSTPSDIEFGRPVDVFDPSKGWNLIVEHPEEEEDLFNGDEDRASSRRASKGKSKAKDTDMTVKAAGISDNAVLAFRFKKEPGVGGEDEDEDELMEADQGWDVAVLSYEDMYGVENEGDLGALPEFKG